MPVELMYTEAMLNPFRDMMRDVGSRGLTGPDVDAMGAALGEMEALAQSLDDFTTFSGQLTQRQLFSKFSDAYSRALVAAAAPRPGEKPSDDSLMETTLRAYEQVLQTYESGGAGEGMKKMAPAVRELVELGRSGISFPVFLRLVEERGMADLLSGAKTVAREGLLESLAFSRAGWAHYDILQHQREVELYDQLAAAAPLGVPDPLTLTLETERIAWELEPSRRRWDAMIRRWETLLDLLVDWLDAFAAFAPYDPRWNPPGASREQAMENIADTQECNPGDFRFREALFKEYFSLTWPEIWQHETFTWQYTSNQISHSDERLMLVLETYPLCQPGGRPSPALIARTEQMHARKAHFRSTNGLPPPDSPLTPFMLPPSML
ncbi:hypothetical protein KJ975_02540 [Myxococcota bacterium]|nr:hypothetical protein [Myxococcota bacterium]